MIRRSYVALIAAALALPPIVAAAPARASTATVCTLAPAYDACGRAFPDPEAGLNTDPNAEGLVPALDFIQFGTPGEPGGSEIWDGLKLLQSRYDRFLEVRDLEDFLGNADARSAGLWLGGQRQRSPLILARVTDETVPASQKKRFVFGLSLHGIERAGVEGGTRALEDLVTYGHCESLGSLEAARADAICAKQTQVKLGAFVEGTGGFPVRLLPWDAGSLTMGDVLKRAELYFTYNNPDGWHRGDKGSFGGVGHYQRYNGNGVDPNRDWPAHGYVYAPYTASSEPETKYFAEALRSLGGNWGGGIDLHGQLNAPVLTYTMLPAGQNDYRKNQRIREIAQRTQQDGLARLGWSPLIDTGEGGPPVDVPFVGAVQMGPQQWGTVWDTIDYTVTGSYGDWMNSPDVGLGGIGMDNEMSLSHVSNCGIGSCFIPEVEQLHVAGNKGLIYSEVDTTLRTLDRRYAFPFEGRGAYLTHDDIVSSRAKRHALRASLTLPPQDAITGQLPCLGAPRAPECVAEFTVEGPDNGVFNGGLNAAVGFAGPHALNDESGGTVEVQRWVDDHGDGGEWVTLAENYDGGQVYAPNGMTADVNDPVPGRYRLLLEPSPPGPYFYEVRFARAHAFDDPGQDAYRATNLDFFDELNRYLPPAKRFEPLARGTLASRPAVLDRYDVIVVPEARKQRDTSPESTPWGALRSYVKRGGTVVLMDGALSWLSRLTRDADLAAKRAQVFAGFVGFQNADGPTYDDPLAAGVNVPGAAEGSGHRHQTYEPVPLGFQILDGFPPDEAYAAPLWGIDEAPFTKAGGRVVGTTEGTVTLGEVEMGKGAIRVAGALLPMPSEGFDHPFGLASYALTYSGWQLFENLVQVDAARAPHLPGPVEVLGGRELPRTGTGAGAVVFLVAIVSAALIARRLRDVYWA